MSSRVMHSYPIDSEALYNMLINKEYIAQKYEAIGAKNILFLEHGEKDNQFIVKTERIVSANIPSFAKKFLNPSSTIIQTEIWHLSNDPVKKSDVEVVGKGLPFAISMKGNNTIQPENEGCQNIFEFDIHVGIPLVGGKIASFLKEEGLKSGEQEYQFNLNYIKSRCV